MSPLEHAARKVVDQWEAKPSTCMRASAVERLRRALPPFSTTGSETDNMLCEKCNHPKMPTRWVYANRLQAGLCPPCERAWLMHLALASERELVVWLGGQTPSNGVQRPA